MNSRLKYDDRRYVLIVYAIWKTLCDLSKKLAVLTEANPTQTANKIIEWDGMALIRFSFDIVENCNIELTNNEIELMLNMQLDYVVLPEIDDLPPYSIDGGYYKMSALYVYEVDIIGDKLFIDVLFIDSPLAYREAQSRECGKVKFYI